MRYIIAYTFIFEYGYVKHTWFSRKSVVPKNRQEAIKLATKWRYKKVAEFYCKIYQWISDKNYDLKTFKVIPIDDLRT